MNIPFPASFIGISTQKLIRKYAISTKVSVVRDRDEDVLNDLKTLDKNMNMVDPLDTFIKKQTNKRVQQSHSKLDMSSIESKDKGKVELKEEGKSEKMI